MGRMGWKRRVSAVALATAMLLGAGVGVGAPALAKTTTKLHITAYQEGFRDGPTHFTARVQVIKPANKKLPLTLKLQQRANGSWTTVRTRKLKGAGSYQETFGRGKASKMCRLLVVYKGNEQYAASRFATARFACDGSSLPWPEG
jgi:hypothetical protein